MVFETDPYTYHTTMNYKEKNGETNPSFDAMKKYIGSDEYEGTIEKSTAIKIGDRDAIKYDYKNENEELYGYSYIINIDDLTNSRSYMKIIAINNELEEDSNVQSFNEKINEVFSTLSFEVKE